MSEIHFLDAGQARRELSSLAEVLADCVAGGASVNFVTPFGLAEARRRRGPAATPS